MCATWSVTLPHPVLHIPLMWNAGQALQFGSTGDEGSSTPARLAFRVISLITPCAGRGPIYLPRMNCCRLLRWVAPPLLLCRLLGPHLRDPGLCQLLAPPHDLQVWPLSAPPVLWL